MEDRLSRTHLLPLGALVLILGVSVAWWALALWPLPADAPAWLEQARLVCFGSTRELLPSAQGWLLLVGEPLAMLGLLFAVWPDALRRALAALWRPRMGKLATATAALALLTLVGTAALRVRGSSGEPFDPTGGAVAERLDRPAPPLALIDQHGRTTRLESFRGRPVLVAFAYAHCSTVCPLIVHDALAAHRSVPETELLVVTLDPWRDTPARLPSIADAWGFGAGTHLLSGDTLLVQRTLDAWEIPRWRDLATGEVTHATFVYLVDRAGRLAWKSPSQAHAVIALLGAL
jgi:protein SCO1/2